MEPQQEDTINSNKIEEGTSVGVTTDTPVSTNEVSEVQSENKQDEIVKEESIVQQTENKVEVESSETDVNEESERDSLKEEKKVDHWTQTDIEEPHKSVRIDEDVKVTLIDNNATADSKVDQSIIVNKDDDLDFEQIIVKYFGEEYKEEAVFILKNTVPLILSNVSQILLTMMSLFFCGHVGPKQLAGVALSNTFMNICVFAVINGLATASDTLFPQLFGGKDKKRLGVLFQKACVISLLASLFCGSFLLNCRNFMVALIPDPEVIDEATAYVSYFVPAIIPFSLVVILSKYLQCQLIFYPVLFINVIANIVNALLQALLIFGMGYGVRGAAISINIANLTQLILMILYIYKTKVYEPTWPGWSYECLYNWKLYLTLGFAGFGLILVECVNFQLAAILAGLLGSDHVSAMSINLQISFLSFLVPFGLGNSGNIRMGQYLGQNQPFKALYTMRVVVAITFMAVFMMSMVIFTFSNYFPLAFTSEPVIVSMASDTFKMLAFSVFFDGLQVIGSAIMRTVGAQVYGILFYLFGFYMIGIPLGGYLLLKTSWSNKGYWLGLTIGCVLIFIAQIIFIYRIDWQKEADKAHNMSTKKGEKRDDIQEINVNQSDDECVNDVERATSGGEDDVDKNLKRKVIKKAFVLLGLIALLLISLYTKDINQIPAHLANSTSSASSIVIH